MASFAIERRLRKQGFTTIIGVDEAGRGPLAGPLVAAAVCLRSTRFRSRVDDSKKLSPKEREIAFREIIQKSLFALSIIDEKKIDELNILVATRECMQRAIVTLVSRLKEKKICILVDGNMKLRLPGESILEIIKGDALSKTIASASILAKVSRDRIMSLYDRLWPEYGFLQHKGYPTLLHRNALKEFGPSPIHRLSFSYSNPKG
ncbi:MAG: ribonuclease HII [Candidatus Omnitrophica bacterium]|nr:ribonuclease HII [Candidatus Omnitrophota bacterium]MBU1871325.1 ribonuclease HII [Candidatus Omnitrophota bacterium]